MRAILIALSIAYPLLVYVGHGSVPPAVYIVAAVALFALRHVLTPDGPLGLALPIMLATAGGLIILALIDQKFAALAYPSMASFAFAAAFAVSLRHPPSLIERLARLRQPHLPEEAIRYCAGLTRVWAVWLSVNGLVAAALAASARMDLWLIWTSLLNYLVSGALFGGEWLLRRARRLSA